MKNILTLSLLFLTSLAISQEKSYDADKLWATPDMLTTSESVCYDSVNKVLYVSCIDGNPTEKDGNGFIAQLSLSGEVQVFRWAGSLNAPKGMGISGDALYVTDIDRVVKLNLEDGKIQHIMEVDGAKFLNDITVGPDGAVYVTDMYTTSVYRVQNDRIALWISNPEFENPNGLNFLGDELLVGTKNGIYGVKSTDKTVRKLVGNTGGIDGLEIFEDGYFIISDWSGKVQLVHPTREPILLFDTTPQGINAADIEYIADRRMLLVPTFMDNRVVAYEIVVREK
jgi:sugar lactone lactonase YvrE